MLCIRLLADKWVLERRRRRRLAGKRCGMAIVGMVWLVVVLVVVVRACAKHGMYFVGRLVLRGGLELSLGLSWLRGVLQRGWLATGMLRVLVLHALDEFMRTASWWRRAHLPLDPAVGYVAWSETTRQSMRIAWHSLRLLSDL